MQPEITLTHGERAQLAMLVPMEGYKILHKIMRTETDKFIVALINADPADKEDLVAKHLLAKSAAMFYAAITNRVNEEVYSYSNAAKASDTPLDITRGLIDLCDLSEHIEEHAIDNLFGEERGQ